MGHSLCLFDWMFQYYLLFANDPTNSQVCRVSCFDVSTASNEESTEISCNFSPRFCYEYLCVKVCSQNVDHLTQDHKI